MHEGNGPQPAFVLLSNNQGGFPRYGFFLDDEDMSGVAYVDVHKDSQLSGRFGALDQIFPHELAHVIRRQLAGEMTGGFGNQVHALGVRTDRVVAFNEGFAEHLQAVAFDASPDVPIMGELATDVALYDAGLERLEAYRRELAARFAFAPPMRMGLLLWYTNDEDVQRYFAVRDNAFAREPDVPERLLRGPDPYAGYLLESMLVGPPNGLPKSLSRMLATEGVVSALFYRWAMDGRLGSNRRDPEFYAPFGVDPQQISDLENVYLKLFEVFYVAKPQTTLDVINGYRERFPDEAAWVEEIASEVFLGKPLEDVPELWLANRAFETGTTVYDQYRGLRRAHTFDLNGASLVDLVSVPGVDLAAARAIRDNAPYAGIHDLAAVPGLADEVVERFVAMEADLDVLVAELEAEADAEDVLSINLLLMPFVWRLVWLVAISAGAGAALYRYAVRQRGGPVRGWPRSIVNGIGAGILGAAGGWGLGGFGLGAVAVVAIVLGLPAAAIQWFRGEPGTAGAVLVGWAIAAVPAALLTTAWF